MAKREFVQLAHTYTGLENVTGWFVSEKLDGMRAYWDGAITRGMPVSEVPFANVEKDGRYVSPPRATGLWSRYGKAIQAPAWWLDKMPEFPLDGELFMGRGQFQTLISAVKKIVPGEEWHRVSYMAFDVPPYHAIFANGEINNVNFKKVFTNVLTKIDLGQRLRTYKPSSWDFRSVCKWLRERPERNEVFQVLGQDELPFRNTSAHSEISRRLDNAVAEGAEGLMIRCGGSFWAPGRVRTLLKIKGMQDAEGIVIGYTAGRLTDKGSKLLGRMGALILRLWTGKLLELSGFTDEERTMCMATTIQDQASYDQAFQICCQIPGKRVPDGVHNPTFPRGSTVSFRYRELTDEGIPKEARFWRKREE